MRLDELRRNPEQNPKTDPFEVLECHYGEEDMFVNFMNLPKLGINPRSPHNTPLGVYAYPLSSNNIEMQIRDDRLPYMGDARYINIIRARGNIINLNDDDRDWKALARHVVMPYYDQLNFIDDDATEEKFFLDLWGYGVHFSKHNSDVSGFWLATMMMVLLVMNKSKPIDDLDDALASAHNGFTNINSAMWAQMFLNAGIDGFVDIGRGIIHINEKTQAVFFNPSVLTLVDRLDNPRAAPDIVVMDDASLHLALNAIGESFYQYREILSVFYGEQPSGLTLTTVVRIQPLVKRKIRVHPRARSYSPLAATDIFIEYMEKKNLYDRTASCCADFFKATIDYGFEPVYFASIISGLMKLWLAALKGDRHTLLTNAYKICAAYSFDFEQLRPMLPFTM